MHTDLLLRKRRAGDGFFVIMSHKKPELHKTFPNKNIKSPKALISGQL